MPDDDDILARIGHSLQSAWGNNTTPAAPAVQREARYAEVSSGAPLTTKTDDPGTSRTVLQVASHGYAPEKAQRMASDQETTRYTRAQRDDIKAAGQPSAQPPQGVSPQALAAALAFLQGRGR